MVNDSTSKPRSRSMLALAALVLAAATLVGCSAGPGTEAEFVEVLMTGDAFSEDQAECIASAVFDEYGDNESALDALSGADEFDSIAETEGLEDFDDFYRGAVDGCVSVGPDLDG